MSHKLAVIAIALLIVVAVQLTNAYPHSDANTVATKPNGLKSNVEAIRTVARSKMQEMCYNVSGTNNAFQDVELAQDRADTCIDLLVNEVVRSRSPITEEDQVIDAIKAVCTKKEDLVKCQSDFVMVANKCLDAKEEKKWKKSAEGFKNIIGYFCDNDAERVTSFTENDGVACFNRSMAHLVECINLSNSSNAILSVIAPISLITFTYDEVAGCKTATTFFKCFIDKMKTCENQTPANIIKGMADQVINSFVECRDDQSGEQETTIKAKSDIVDVI